MVITYNNGQCFKLVFGDTTLAFDPISKKSSLSPVKFGADIVVSSMHHPDFNGIAEVTYGSKQPFVVDGPGAYEVDGITIRGFGVKSTYDGAERYNTIYQVTFEGMRIVFLGALSSADIDSQILGELGDIDILFIPIGGGDVLEASEAAKLETKLEAKCTIPMHFDANALGAFLKEESAEDVMPQDKLKIKKKDIAEMRASIVVLQAK